MNRETYYVCDCVRGQGNDVWRAVEFIRPHGMGMRPERRFIHRVRVHGRRPSLEIYRVWKPSKHGALAHTFLAWGAWRTRVGFAQMTGLRLTQFANPVPSGYMYCSMYGMEEKRDNFYCTPSNRTRSYRYTGNPEETKNGDVGTGDPAWMGPHE